MALIGVTIGSASCIKCVFPHTGNGKLETWEKDVSTFEKINCSGNAEVRYHVSDEYRAVVTIDANLRKHIEVFTKNNVLIIRPETGSNFSPTKFLVDVYAPVLYGVTIWGSGSFAGMDIISASSFAAVISGSGKVQGAVECGHFSAKISGSGKITVDGYCKDADISISGSGNFNGNELMIKNAKVNISGSGNVNVFVTDYLNAIISGSGKINYRGEPKIDTKVSGSGRIRKM